MAVCTGLSVDVGVAVRLGVSVAVSVMVRVSEKVGLALKLGVSLWVSVMVRVDVVVTVSVGLRRFKALSSSLKPCSVTAKSGTPAFNNAKSCLICSRRSSTRSWRVVPRNCRKSLSPGIMA